MLYQRLGEMRVDSGKKEMIGQLVENLTFTIVDRISSKLLAPIIQSSTNFCKKSKCSIFSSNLKKQLHFWNSFYRTILFVSLLIASRVILLWSCIKNTNKNPPESKLIVSIGLRIKFAWFLPAELWLLPSGLQLAWKVTQGYSAANMDNQYGFFLGFSAYTVAFVHMFSLYIYTKNVICTHKFRICKDVKKISSNFKLI